LGLDSRKDEKKKKRHCLPFITMHMDHEKGIPRIVENTVSQGKERQ
jgi:hypothetical protein